MAEKNKSIIESALLDINRIQEALNSNTKEILRTVAVGEIDKVVKESINEDDYEEEDVEDTDLAVADADDAGDDVEDVSVDVDAEVEGDEESDDIELGDDNEDEVLGMDNMEDSGVEADYDGVDSEEDYEMDMTGASDEDVIAVYKKLSGDDEIEVVSDTEVKITDPVSGAEYQVKLGGGEPDMGVEAEPEMELGLDAGMEMDVEPEMEESVYEIAMDDELSENELTEDTKIGATADGKVRTATSDVTMGKESAAPNTGDIEGQKAPLGKESVDNFAGDNLEGGFDEDGQNGSGDNHGDHIMEEEDCVDETVTEEDTVTEEEEETVDENLGSTRGYAGRQGAKKGGDDHHPSRKDESISKAKYKKLVAEHTKLKKQNGEFKVALKKFRTMLGESVVFNTNLTNVTRLFTEHSTTRNEKEAIMARFDDEATTIKESKRLYKTIANELGSKKPISESVESKIIKEASTSKGSKANLNESTAYVDSSTQRIKDLINRVEKPI